MIRRVRVQGALQIVMGIVERVDQDSVPPGCELTVNCTISPDPDIPRRNQQTTTMSFTCANPLVS